MNCSMSPRAIGCAVPSRPPRITCRRRVSPWQTGTPELTRLPLAETTEPKWRSWCSGAVSAQLLLPGSYLRLYGATQAIKNNVGWPLIITQTMGLLEG
jgi:hypothetical protein